MSDHPKHGVQHVVQPFAHVFSQHAHHPESVLLHAQVFGPVPPVGLAVAQVLRTVQLDDQMQASRAEIHLHLVAPLPRDRQTRVEREQTAGRLQCLQPPEKKSLRRAARPRGAARIVGNRPPGGMHEQIGQRRVHAIAAQTPHTGRIGLLPRRFHRHRDLRRPRGVALSGSTSR
jgi:hypothetical protein